jgi:competence protein ComEA
MKKAFFPLLSLVFIIACAVFVYLAREAETVHVVQLTADNEQLTINEPLTGADGSVRPPVVETQLININTASLEELMTLQGIGPAIGQRIIDYREDSGLFMTIEELMEVPGIGEAVFGNIQGLITV